MKYAIGLDIGGTNAKAVCITVRGTILLRKQFPTEEHACHWRERIRELLDSLQRRHRAAWIGIAAPGLSARDHRSIWWMQGRMSIVEGLDWTALLQPRRPIPVLNDAHAALLGEAWLGAARGLRHVALLTLGTGVGGAILENGRLLQGTIGRAGHLGHICLDPDGPPDVTNLPGSLENAIGECTLAARTHGRFSSTRELLAAAREGDADAKRIWERSVWELACGIASIINVADPEAVIVGGGIARAGNALFSPLRKFLARVEWRPHGHRVRVVRARLGEWAGALGAARYAMTRRSNS